MLELVVSGATTAAPGDSSDWVARILSAISILLTIVFFIITQRGKGWRGRKDALVTIADTLSELRLVVEAVRQNPTNAYQLWTVTSSAAMEALQEEHAAFPDRKLRRELKALIQHLSTARGNVPIVVELGQDPPALKGKQSIALHETEGILTRIDARILKIKLKGSVN